MLINLSSQQTGRKTIMLIVFLDKNQWLVSFNHISLLTLFHAKWNKHKQYYEEYSMPCTECFLLNTSVLSPLQTDQTNNSYIIGNQPHNLFNLFTFIFFCGRQGFWISKMETGEDFAWHSVDSRYLREKQNRASLEPCILYIYSGSALEVKKAWETRRKITVSILRQNQCVSDLALSNPSNLSFLYISQLSETERENWTSVLLLWSIG